jgi:hypothetical protein
MISYMVHLRLHAARRADLMRQADRQRLIRTLNRPRNRRDPATSTRREPISTLVADGGAATTPRTTAGELA